MLRTIKQGGLAAARMAGLFKVASASSYRNSRVFIIGYHSVALLDEHIWDPALYISSATLRRRFEIIRRSNCTVLSLDDAISRLNQGSLPPRTVVLTFDDGTCDFHSIVWPMLQEFGFPATVYLTTFYVENPYPVVPGIFSYLLWKAGNVKFNARSILGQDVTFDITDQATRHAAWQQITAFTRAHNLDPQQKHVLAAELARLIGVDYQQLCHQRLLHLMTPDEVRHVARAGASVQMHMHRHITPPQRDVYLENLEANRRFITGLTGSSPTHFCYPSGAYTQQSVGWLRELGIASATTCEPGLMSATTDALLIPRLIDTSFISDLAFESWLVGIGPLMTT